MNRKTLPILVFWLFALALFSLERTKKEKRLVHWTTMIPSQSKQVVDHFLSVTSK
jgi:hypothetical protein